jgi:hypothetical protein
MARALRLVVFLLLAASPAACGDETTFVNDDPPSDDDDGGGGDGGFDPGPSPNAASNGAYGYGAGSPGSTTGGGPASTSSASGGEGGAGGSGGSGGEPPPECDEADRRCEHTFSYENAGAASVEVRGDFAPGAWDDGVDMVNDGGTWTATVPLPWDTDVQYRFFLNGGEWITDPANPDTVDDGFGGLNSLLAGQTCPDDFICVE